MDPAVGVFRLASDAERDCYLYWITRTDRGARDESPRKIAASLSAQNQEFVSEVDPHLVGAPQVGLLYFIRPTSKMFNPINAGILFLHALKADSLVEAKTQQSVIAAAPPMFWDAEDETLWITFEVFHGLEVQIPFGNYDNSAEVDALAKYNPRLATWTSRVGEVTWHLVKQILSGQIPEAKLPPGIQLDSDAGQAVLIASEREGCDGQQVNLRIPLTVLGGE